MDTPNCMSVLEDFIPLSPKKTDVPLALGEENINATSNEVVSPIDPLYTQQNTGASSSIDDFLENTKCKVLEQQNSELRASICCFADKCHSLRAEILRGIDDLNSARRKNAFLSKKNNDLEEMLAKETLKLKTILNEKHRLSDESHDAYEALKEQKRLTTQNSQENDRLKQKVGKLEEMLTSEYDRCKEYKLALENLKSVMQNLITQKPHSREDMHQQVMNPVMHPVMNPVMHPVMHDMAPSYHIKQDSYDPYMVSMAPLEYTFDCRPAIEKSIKRKAEDGDLREVLMSKPGCKTLKRLCYNGERCKYSRNRCDFAHSIEELNMCHFGKRCTSKARCGFMIHSKEDRIELARLVKADGKQEMLCAEYDNYKKCKDGALCKKIHYNY